MRARAVSRAKTALTNKYGKYEDSHEECGPVVASLELVRVVRSRVNDSLVAVLIMASVRQMVDVVPDVWSRVPSGNVDG